MESERSYSAVQYSARSMSIGTVSGAGIYGGTMNREGPGESGTSFADTLFRRYARSGGTESPNEEADDESGSSIASVDDIMKDMLVKGSGYANISAEEGKTDIYVRKMSVLYIFSILFEDFRKQLDDMMAGLRRDYECAEGRTGTYLADISAKGGFGQSSPRQVFRFEIKREDYYREEEETSFSARGKAVCSDGREIDFNINARMSRSFEQYSSGKVTFDLGCIDPLVINLNDGVTSVSDQDFYFDLDADGKEDRIKALSDGSGFLALDKNGDGKINDGSELFGTGTGDGFAELAVYDDDGDGWIDEDDDVFDRLRVWTHDRDGREKLLTFRDLGIGAVNLANVPTRFSMTDSGNRAEAIVRATGMFLYEDGRAGCVQQVDMVS